MGGRVDWSHATDLIAAGIVGRDGYADIELLRPDGTRLACLTCGHPQVPQKHNDLPAWHPSWEYWRSATGEEVDFVVETGGGCSPWRSRPPPGRA
ncbi:MAG: hypothetical protein QN183_09510 [Armatimonadota bacterium]|nr:hypothetical protein [Armatimonadota bacterium]MDR7536588.1 hypothetical protein [Armatimonadota bacterium]